MTDTNTGLNIRQRLLAGTLNSSQLQTELGDANKKACFNAMISNFGNAQKLFENPTSFLAIFNSALAWGIVKTSSNAIDAIISSLTATKIAVENSVIIDDMLNNENFDNSFRKRKFDTLKFHINRSYSKLKRTIITNSGNFTPANNILKLAFILIGAGGGGGEANSGNGYGGGGGEIVVNFFTNLTASTNYAVSIGIGGASNSNGTSTTFTNNTTVVTANGGKTGGGITFGEGGGSTTGLGIKSLSDYDLLNACWQIEAFSQKGGQGETNSLKRSFFKEFGGNKFTNYEGQAGDSIASGGNRYPIVLIGSGGITADGLSAEIENYGAGGGGASSYVSSGGGLKSGGKGADGIAILYYIEA